MNPRQKHLLWWLKEFAHDARKLYELAQETELEIWHDTDVEERVEKILEDSHSLELMSHKLKLKPKKTDPKIRERQEPLVQTTDPSASGYLDGKGVLWLHGIPDDDDKAPL